MPSIYFGHTAEPWRSTSIGQPLNDAKPSARYSQGGDVMALTDRMGNEQTGPVPLFFTPNGEVIGCIYKGHVYGLKELLDPSNAELAGRLQIELNKRGIKPQEMR